VASPERRNERGERREVRGEKKRNGVQEMAV
jgi:hypothetical protein